MTPPPAGWRVLAVAHRFDYDPGVIGERLEQLGATLELMPREEPDAWPEVGQHDLILPFGSVWMAEDPALAEPVAAERRFLRDAMDAGVPVLAICFGAQQLAAALGGAVIPSPRPEVGWFTVGTRDGAEIPDGPWMQFHYDAVEPPGGAEVLAGNEVCVQAYAIGNALAVQFHPEVTPDTVRRWLRDGGDEHLERLGMDRASLLADSDRHAPAARAAAHRLVDRFLERVGAVAWEA